GGAGARQHQFLQPQRCKKIAYRDLRCGVIPIPIPLTHDFRKNLREVGRRHTKLPLFTIFVVVRRELPDHRYHLRIERSGNRSGGHQANRINSAARRTLCRVLWLEETLQRLRRSTMNFRILASFASAMLAATFAAAGNPGHSELHVLSPVTRGNLTIFPVVGGAENDTGRLLTLDEGLRSGAVVVAEAGSLRGLIRPGSTPPRQSGDAVNRLG